MNVTKMILLRLWFVSVILSALSYSQTSEGRMVVAEVILQNSERLSGARWGDPDEIERRAEKLLIESGLLEKLREIDESEKNPPK